MPSRRRREDSVTVKYNDGTVKVFVGKAAEQIGEFIDDSELKPKEDK